MTAHDVRDRGHRRKTCSRRCSTRATSMAAGRPILEDIERQPITYRPADRRQRGARPPACRDDRARRAGGRAAAQRRRHGRVAFFALQAFGRVPAMLNYSDRRRQHERSPARRADPQLIVTSRRFIERGQARGGARRPGRAAAGSSISRISAPRSALLARLRGLLTAARFLRGLHRRMAAASPDDPAVVLFTSGSEGDAQGRGAEPRATSWPTASRSARRSISTRATSSSTRCRSSIPSG